nr:HAMP domain-containing sensor histidine kinase [Azospirillum sp. INR13]
MLSLRPRLRRTRVTVELDIRRLIVDGIPAPSPRCCEPDHQRPGHAYDEGEAGRILLSAREQPAGWIEMHYADDGKGIPADIRPRIFEPFFTTKRGMGASGLGLSICANIMTGTMRGSIALEEGGGKGTRFVLRFPVG